MDLTSTVAGMQLAEGAFFEPEHKEFFAGSAWKGVRRFDFAPADLQLYYVSGLSSSSFSYVHVN